MPAPTATSDVSVIVCAYDDRRWRDLRAAVDSLARQSLPPREVTVVVDHNPRLFERARAGLAGVNVVENANQRGLAGARNSGIVASSSAVVAFIDDDAVASSDWLRLLMREYGDPRVAGVGGRTEPTWIAGRPSWFPPEFDWVVGCTYRGAPQGTIRNLIGCNMSFRRELLVLLGGFLVEPYCDETEICIRLLQRWPEKRLACVPEARVAHRVSTGRARLPYFFRRCYIEGRAKARVTRLVGAEDALATERDYVRSVLPNAAFKNLGEFARGSDWAGLARVSVIAAGLATTGTAYAISRLSPMTDRGRQGRDESLRKRSAGGL